MTVDDVFTSLSAARSLISSKNLRPMLILENEAMQDFQGIETSDPDCVVVGLATSQEFIKYEEEKCIIIQQFCFDSFISKKKNKNFKDEEKSLKSKCSTRTYMSYYMNFKTTQSSYMPL